MMMIIDNYSMMIMLLITRVMFASLVGAPSSVRGAQNLQCSVGKRRRRSAHSWLHTDWGKGYENTLGKRGRSRQDTLGKRRRGHTGEKVDRTHWGKDSGGHTGEKEKKGVGEADQIACASFAEGGGSSFQ